MTGFNPLNASRKKDHGRGAVAALLNASGLSAGYFHLGAWGRGFGSLAVTALIFAIAAGTGAGTNPLWAGILLGLWLALLSGHAWILGAQGPPPNPGAPHPMETPPTGAAPPGPPAARSAGARWPTLATALVLLAGVAAGFVYYRGAAERTYETASAAHAEGDCPEAMADYERVNGRYWLSFTPVAGAAAAEAEACALLVYAEEQRAEGEWKYALGVYGRYLDTGAETALWEGLEATLAQTRLDLAHTYAEQAAEAGLDGRRDFENAFETYAEILDEHPGSPEAESVPEAVEELYEAAAPNAGEEHCAAVEELDFVAGFRAEIAEPLAERALDALPEAVFGCGEEHAEDEDYAEAEEVFTRVLDDFPDSSQADRAQTRLQEVEEAIAEEEARQAEQDIIDTIDEITGGTTEDLPPPTASGSAPGGTVSMEITNGSNRDLEMLYTGPETEQVTIGTDESMTLQLAPGAYQVVVRASGGGVIPFSGSWSLASGTAYSEYYYITFY